MEAVNNGWTKRELERQINSLLYERLLLSNDKEAVDVYKRQVSTLLFFSPATDGDRLPLSIK